MESRETTCLWISRILNGKASYENGMCTVTISRDDLQATIGGTPFHAVHHVIHFENLDSDNSLITGELVLNEGEVPNMVEAVSRAGIIVSAVHNNWIVEYPRLMYINIMAIANPVNFSNNLARILTTVTGHTI